MTTFIPNIVPENGNLRHLFKKYPEITGPLGELHDVILRSKCALSVPQREFIAGYVSSINACEYCAGVHSLAAEIFGIDRKLLNILICKDPEINFVPDSSFDEESEEIVSIPIGTINEPIPLGIPGLSEQFRSVLIFARSLTLSPSRTRRIGKSLVKKILDSGLDEEVIVFTSFTVGIFSMMNRVVDGLNLQFDEAYFQDAAKRTSSSSYSSLKQTSKILVSSDSTTNCNSESTESSLTDI